ncbi:2-isopropylmalate synthase [Lysobacter pythonis]|uniref:2-isopropylmalate synthase n=1 Tax=Solilutibacter pythonis TaxID=2483112 RepID=A0A3M2HTP4_9GAMM|nr:2-isopropylmalate synthase [Lysobacter pythonis]RMH93106.1 2-isopropylmalate synthase [Lysobacter pythonis]
MNDPTVSTAAEDEAIAPVRIFDTTLRDGEQSPGCSMSPRQKQVMARALAELGVDVIETGFPASAEADREATRLIVRDLAGGPTAPCVLSRCVRGDIEASARALEGSANGRIHVFISTSALHREHKLRMDQDAVIEAIATHVAHAARLIGDVEFSCEDATRTEPDFLLRAVEAAVAAGATTINLPDTLGYATPEEMTRLFARMRQALPAHVVLSAHCHDDLGLAVANSLAAVEGGARQIECTINGIGERAGNCAMEELAMALKVRRGWYRADTRLDTRRLLDTSRLLSRLIGMPVQRNKAIVGANAFAHESGIHQHGMLKHRETYEIMRPEDVGWPDSQLVLGRHSGRAALSHRLRALGYTLEEAELDRVFADFKNLCERQRVIEERDLETLMQGEVRGDGYRLASMTVSDRGQRASAQVELSTPDGEHMIESALGDGPVDALFSALARATGVRLALESYQVHSIGIGTDARGEASLTASDDGRTVYEGIGTSADIIEASALAWLDIANRILRARGDTHAEAAA